MVTSSDDDPRGPANPEVKLRLTLAAFPGRRFAVLDGGHFDDLPARLKRERLFARSLFLDHADVEVEKAGPWLVGLDQAPDAIEKSLSVVGHFPAAVFWSCEGGEAILFRHLRTLNMAHIPAWAAFGGESPPANGVGQDLKAVMFRHWDPRVLGALMPVLDAGQFRRVLGPAEEIAFVAEDFGGVRRVVRDDDWPPAPSGLLALTSDQIQSLSGRQVDASRRRIMSYLHAVWPDAVPKPSDADLLARIEDSHDEGTAIGFKTERAQSRLAYLMVLSEGHILGSPGVRPFLLARGSDPDQQMEVFMASLLAGRQRLGDVP